MRFFVGLTLGVFLLGCKTDEKPPEEKIIRTYEGDVEVLNSCGIPGAAGKMRTFLRENGFDVVNDGNDRLQNYEETVIVLRNPEWEGAKALAKTLKTNNVLVVYSERATVDAAVYVGKDFKQIIEPEQGENYDK